MPIIEKTIGDFHDASHGRIRKIGVYRGPISMPGIFGVPGDPTPASPNAGDPFRPQDIGLSRIEFITFSLAVDPADPLGFAIGQFTLLYVYELEFVSWGGAVAIGQNLNNHVARFEAIGI